MSRLPYSLLLLTLLFSTPAFPAVTAIDAHGLADKYITAITEDSQGLMWIGTRQGLYTYDGYEFLLFSNTSLSNANISRLLYRSASDRLWIVTDVALYSLQCRTRRLEKAWDLGGAGQLTGMAEGRDGTYASLRNGTILFIGDNSAPRIIAQLPPGNLSLLGITRADNGNAGRDVIHLHNAEQSYQLEVSAGRMILQKAGKPLPGLIKVAGTSRITLQDGLLRLFRPDTAGQLVPALGGKGFSAEDLTDSYVRDTLLYVLRKPSYISQVNTNTGAEQPVSDNAFNGRLTTCLFFDRQGLIWAGTNKGLIRITPEVPVFRRSLIQSPVQISVRTLTADEQGDLYASTYCGMYRRAPGSDSWRLISNLVPYCFLNCHGDYLYFGGELHSLFRIHKKTGRIETNFYTREKSYSLFTTYGMLAEGDSLIWLGGTFGLAMFNRVTNRLSAPLKLKGLDSAAAIRSIRPAGDGQLWLCTSKGLALLDKRLGITWSSGRNGAPALSPGMVNDVSQGADGRLWICTAGGGINILSADRRQVAVLNTDNGLSDNVTYNLLWDRKGRAWISTYNGLSSYDTAHSTFYNYYSWDGLTNNECNHNSYLSAGPGTMYFGTISGLNAFDPGELPLRHSRHFLFASSVTKWDNATKSVLPISPADAANVIRLQPLDHSLSFSLAMTDFSNPVNNIYRYRIKGLFDRWNTLNSQHTLRLDGLAPGTYQLEIRAFDSHGLPSANQLHYSIVVSQAFYKAWWFYLLLFLSASLLIWGFFYLRLRHIKRMQVLREQIASDLHDEVGSLLTRITMTSDSLAYAQQPANDPAIHTGLNKIAALSRSAVASMSDILWSIDARNDYTGNLADRMREHAEDMLLPLGIQLHFDIDVPPKLSLDSVRRQQLYLIFKEAINNIAKHSRARDVQVRYHHQEKGYELWVENDGAVAKNTSTKGQGLKNMLMRAKRIGAKYDVNRHGDRFGIRIKG